MLIASARAVLAVLVEVVRETRRKDTRQRSTRPPRDVCASMAGEVKTARQSHVRSIALFPMAFAIMALVFATWTSDITVGTAPKNSVSSLYVLMERL